MLQDPWQHRSQGMRCATCMWFVAKGPLGRCRRHAPSMSGYPVVYPTDWCGDHKLDETKLSSVPEPLFGDLEAAGLPPHDPESCEFCQRDGAVPFHPEG